MAIVKGDRIGESQRLNRCSIAAQDFYGAMVGAEVPDDFGRFRETAHHVWIRMYPRREPTRGGLARVKKLMAELKAAGLWKSWAVDGVDFAELYNWEPRGNLYHRTPEPPVGFYGSSQVPHGHTRRCATTALARAREWGDSESLPGLLLLINKKAWAEPERGRSETRADEGAEPEHPSLPFVPSLPFPPTDNGPTTTGAPTLSAGERVKIETEGLRLIRLIAEASNLDPTEVIVKASTGNGRYSGSRKARLDTMTDDRLKLTVIDLRDEWARVAPKNEAPADSANPTEAWFARDRRTPRQLAEDLRADVGGDGKVPREARDAWLAKLGAPEPVKILVIQALFHLEKPETRAG